MILSPLRLAMLPPMEGWLRLCLVALFTLLAIWLLKLITGGKCRPAAKKQLPPGPWTLPVIGSLHHVASVLPHRTLMELSRRHGPLMLLRLGEAPTVIVSTAEAAALVMKTNDLAFAGRPQSATLDVFGCGGKGIALAPYGDHWRQMLKVSIVELLSSRQVKRLEGIRAEEVGNLLRSITAAASSGGATINLSEKMTALSNHVVTRAVFGGKFSQQEEYLREMAKVFVMMGGFCLVDLFPSSRLVRWLSNGERDMKNSCGRMHHIISDIIQERKAARAAGVGPDDDKEDLLDVLLRLQKDDSLEFPLTTESISTVLLDIFAGGTETTGSTLAWAMSELVRNPEIMAKAQQEIQEVVGEDRAVITNSDLTKLRYTEMVIKEALRLHPPVPLIPRAAREDCTVMGFDIPKGTNVYINVVAISQDPEHWSSPAEFKPERFENNPVNYNGTYLEFIPFGAGRRQCPGTQFGTSLVEMVLTNILYHFDWKLLDGASLASFDMSEKFGLTLHRRNDLKLRATPHVLSKAMPLE
ncbi:hypothetical protein CFC21_027025 [Triticum aestivum]|uniref:Cytochrome P450 n=2 Tax=Triticum aestivum TaxID=4565 RepID=A0A3B6D765_WHEAT|nr:desmethyl-deoxy-podophyllotoxin synthase-like [Triticum aestivum]KAF7012877.1 hypothetical protein CFC21_027025 [Triticum aestivum]